MIVVHFTNGHLAEVANAKKAAGTTGDPFPGSNYQSFKCLDGEGELLAEFRASEVVGYQICPERNN